MNTLVNILIAITYSLLSTNTTVADQPTTITEQPIVEDTKIDYSSNYIEYYNLYNYDIGFIGTTTQDNDKYRLFDNYDDYLKCYNNIDTWSQENIENFTKKFNDSSEESRKKAEKNYKELVSDRVAKIKGGFEKVVNSPDFFKSNNLILVEHLVQAHKLYSMYLDDISYQNNTIQIQFYETHGGYSENDQSRIFYITIPKSAMSFAENVSVIVYDIDSTPHDLALKPIIYLYPSNEEEVSVVLGYKDKITCSYPTYVDGWKVTAKPDGNLVNNATGRNLYSLYYESNNVVDFNVENEGFVIKGKDTATFLEDKLAILGLNEREAEEFIVYWLPKLEANNYSYIRFATNEEINNNMPLEISPEPDTTIRILMTFKALDNPIDVKEQELITPSRDGFTAVEWGGTEIK